MVRAAKQYGPLVVAVAALLCLFGLWVPSFLQGDNLLDLAQQISVNAIIAFGMTLVILIGGIDLSVGALLALVGTTTVFVLTHGPHDASWVLPAGLAAGVGMAVVFGAFNGLFAAMTKLPPFIITLATMLVARGAALRYNEGRPMTFDETHGAFFLALGNGRVFGCPVPILVMLILFAVPAVVLHFTRFGRHLYAIGGNSEAARLSGVPLARATVIVYVVCALLAGIAGMINTSQLYMAEPAAGAGFELNAIAAVVVGGTSFSGGIGTMPGTLIGAVIIGILDKGLNQAGVHYSLQYVVKGCVILGAVFLDVMRRRK